MSEPHALRVDPSLAQELVDFWAKRCYDLTLELKEAKSRSAIMLSPVSDSSPLDASSRDILLSIQATLAHSSSAEKELRDLLSQSMCAEKDARTKLTKTMKEMCDVQAKLTRWEAEGVALRAQVATFHAQASVISTETDRVRKDAITALFPLADFLEDTFKPRVLSAPDIPTFVASLTGTGALQKYRLYLLPKPPSCMPLRVQFCGSHGYWFAPTTVPPDDFELIVEGRAGEWTYLGKYVTAPFLGHEMRLAEWMNLDELTKLAYCARLHPSSGTQPQATSPVEIKRRHDIGEWVAPCYSLRCVGFSTDLYELLIQKLGTKAASTSAQQSSTTTPIVKNFTPASTRKYASGGIEAGIGSPPLLVTSKRGKRSASTTVAGEDDVLMNTPSLGGREGKKAKIEAT